MSEAKSLALMRERVNHFPLIWQAISEDLLLTQDSHSCRLKLDPVLSLSLNPALPATGMRGE